jgi:diaminohydroxyphosphoribosylaminopyrimidine deaminase/5-amino-6-(5-phosphoribosylamino)uracil reductase
VSGASSSPSATRSRGWPAKGSRLRAAGVQVEMADADLARAAREINIGFFSRVERGRPWVRVKVASSLDGRSALADGRSQWITGPDARADGHAWRRRAGAVLTGIGTVLADDPRLDVRLVPTERQPLRVVLDAALRLPSAAKIAQPPGAVLVYTATGTDVPAGRFETGAVEIARVSAAGGALDLESVLADLARRGVNELHVEAGATLNGAWLGAGLADELLLYVAPILVGPGRGIADTPALATLADARRFACIDVARVGDDLRLRLRPAVA